MRSSRSKFHFSQVCVHRAKQFRNRDDATIIGTKPGITMAQDDVWERYRLLLGPFLSQRLNLERFARTAVQRTAELMNSWPMGGGVVNQAADTLALSRSVLFSVLFSQVMCYFSTALRF